MARGKAKKSTPETKDIEMKDDSKDASKENGKGEGEAKKEPRVKTQSEINQETVALILDQYKLIDRTVSTKEPRHALRVTRSIPQTRKKINAAVLRKIITKHYNGREATDAANKEVLLSFVEEPMDDAMETKDITEGNEKKTKKGQMKILRSPETDVYTHLLVLIYLIDGKSFESAVKLSAAIINKLLNENRRTLDVLASKCYFYYSRAFELVNKLEEIRPVLHSRLRTATLNHDLSSQATLLNLLLRNYLHYNLYDQAEKLSSKATFPEQASNNERARYLYYTGRINAIQLEYSEAHQTLISALRKAPQNAGVGFKQYVTKLLVVVELLLGEAPERAQFKVASMEQALQPYFELTQAVRTGDLSLFTEVLDKYAEKFQADTNFTLILRVRHNVIKAGVRRISVGYSRISLNDVAQKLQLDSAEDAEFIIAKAIKDGVIEADINHEQGFVQTKDTTDVYSTNEPQKAFHNRISFCFDIYKSSVMAMRFPPKSYQIDLESAEERRERELQDIEFAKEVAEEDEDY